MAKNKKKIVKVAKKSKPVVKKAAAKKVKKKITKPAAKKAVSKKSVVAKKAMPAFKAPSKVASKIKIAELNNFVTPLDDRMIVQVKETETRTAGGLYIPDTAVNDVGHHEAIVLSVGRGHRSKKGHLRPMDVKVGDKILFNNMSGSKLVYQNVDLKILRETDVMGVVDKD